MNTNTDTHTNTQRGKSHTNNIVQEKPYTK